jgi:hypothetical protein
MQGFTNFRQNVGCTNLYEAVPACRQLLFNATGHTAIIKKERATS